MLLCVPVAGDTGDHLMYITYTAPLAFGCEVFHPNPLNNCYPGQVDHPYLCLWKRSWNHLNNQSQMGKRYRVLLWETSWIRGMTTMPFQIECSSGRPIICSLENCFLAALKIGKYIKFQWKPITADVSRLLFRNTSVVRLENTDTFKGWIFFANPRKDRHERHRDLKYINYIINAICRAHFTHTHCTWEHLPWGGSSTA